MWRTGCGRHNRTTVEEMTVGQYLQERNANEMAMGLCAGDEHRGYWRGSMCRERVYVMTVHQMLAITG